MPFPNSLDRLRSRGVREKVETNERSRRLRVDQTNAEAMLWELLRGRKLTGMKFRRQAPLGRYIADFYCHDQRLVVELDGPVHSEPAQAVHDQNRDTFLRSLGLTVLRFSNEEVVADPENVLRKIQDAFRQKP
jgi:very-short-patch-repair endonuclease